jgi:hypothetical protein
VNERLTSRVLTHEPREVGGIIAGMVRAAMKCHHGDAHTDVFPSPSKHHNRGWLPAF